MIEILYMLGQIQRRYVIGPDRYEEPWIARHRELAALLSDRPDSRVSLDLDDAPYLEYGADLPAWARHPELSDHQWICGYDKPGSARPIYAGWLAPQGRDSVFVASGAAMIAALTGGGTDGSAILPEIEAAAPEACLVGGYTPDMLASAQDQGLVAQLVSESVPCLALLMLGEIR